MRADGAVDVHDRQLVQHLLAASRAPAAPVAISSLSSAMSSPWSCLCCAYDADDPSCGFLAGVRICDRSRPFGFPVVDRGVDFRAASTRPTISLIVRKPSSAMIMPQLFGDHEQVVDDVLRLAGELLAQLRILRRDADRAGVQVTLAHHDAAERDQRRGGEAEFFGAEERGDGDVAAGLELTVGLQHHAAAQVVHHQRLVRFGDAELPRQAGVLDRWSAATHRCRRCRRRSGCDRRAPSPRRPRSCRRRLRRTSFTLMRAFGFAFFRS